MTSLFRTTFSTPLRNCTCRRTLSTATSSTLPPPASIYTLPKGLELTGIVTKHAKIQKTITVQVERRMTDHKTLKEFSKHSKYLVHDPEHTCVVGDQVKIRNCRPISSRKRFELVQVLKGARERVESSHGPGAVEETSETTTTSS